jgi:Transposase, Mutator family
VVALGIGIDGVKHPLAVEEGSTENATLVTGLGDRGLDVTRPILAVLDGAKALTRAVKDVFDKPIVQRCQQHKIRNVIDKLPDRLKQVAERRMRQAYHAESALKAEGLLGELARELNKTLWVPVIVSRYATCEYSWIRPPRRSRRRTRILVTSASGWTRPAGGLCCSARWGLCEL